VSEAWAVDENLAFREATGSTPNSEPSIEAPTSWWPIDLGPIVAGLQAGKIVGPVPRLMTRTDGPCLLYPGEIHSLAGEPETGKGWIALATTAATITDGGHVLYLDCEDSPASIVSRLLALGVPAAHILERFVYVRPTDPFTAPTLDALLASHTYTLAVIDGLSEAYALLGLDSYNNNEVAKFLSALARPIAAAGAAVLLIDHVVKAKEGRGRYALGAQHKLAGIAVAYTTDTITAPSRTQAGLIKLKLEKDRHGHVRSHAHSGTIALVHITPDHDGQTVTVTLEPPETSVSDTGQFLPTLLMSRVSEFVHEHPGASLNAIKESITGRGEWISKAVDLLVTDGHIERQKHGKSYTHHHLRNYQPQPSPTDSQPIPGLGSSDRVPESPPLRDSDSGTTPTGPTNRVP
jgi:hypothetical protein